MTDLKCVIVASTGGSVMNALLDNAFFKRQIFAVLADRPCGAIDKAAAHGVSTLIIPERKSQLFCDQLLQYLQTNQIDYVISFFTKLFVGDLVEIYRDRIINLHPSLLPSFKGLDGFGDALRYGVRYIGTTIHFIDEQMDEGKIIMQTMCPLDVTQSQDLMRHRIFQQQCKSLLQVLKWLEEGRIRVQGKQVLIENVTYASYEFSPNLDFEDAVRFTI